MIKVLIIPVEEPARVEEIAGDLASLRAAVGDGWLEHVSLDADKGTHLYVDEEGKLKGQPINWSATTLWRDHQGIGADVLCGTAVVLGGTPDGEEADCPQDIIDNVLGAQPALAEIPDVDSEGDVYVPNAPDYSL